MGLKGKWNWDCVTKKDGAGDFLLYNTRSNHRRYSLQKLFLKISKNSQENRKIQSECGKIRTRKTSNTDTFHAV